MTRSKIYASKIDAWLVAVSLSCAVAVLTSLLTASPIGSTGMTVFIGLLAAWSAFIKQARAGRTIGA